MFKRYCVKGYSLDPKDSQCYICKRQTEYCTVVLLENEIFIVIPTCSTHKPKSVEQIAVHDGETTLTEIGEANIGFRVLDPEQIEAEVWRK